MTLGKPSVIKQLQNDTGVFFCLTVLRGIYNSVGEAGGELMISTEKHLMKGQTMQEREKIMAYFVAQHE